MMVSWRTFGMAVVCALPFIIVNFLVAMPVPAFVAWLRPDGHTSVLELCVLWGAIVSMLVGGWVALSAVWHQRRLVLLNGLLGITLLMAGAALVYAFGAEIVACEWQNVPNCD